MNETTALEPRYERLAYVALNVTDIEASRAFYEKQVGLQYSATGPEGEVYFRCGYLHHSVVLYPASAPGLKRIGFELADSPALDALRERVGAQGVAIAPIKDETDRLLGQRARPAQGNDVTPDVAQTAGEVREQTGGEIGHFVADLSHETGASALIGQALDRFSHLNILVNNAGGGVILPFLRHTPQTLRETVDRNLWTALWCCYYALPHMVERNYGRIINIGADSVRNGLWDHAGYNAAKGGVHAMTTGLAREFATHEITVNTVAPCVVDSERLRMRMADSPELAQKVLGVVPKGRAVKATEIASLVAYLAGEEDAFITGQVVSINGGSTML